MSNPQEYPIFGSVFSQSSRQKFAYCSLLVIPASFRLEANQQGQLRIVRTGGDMPTDRETLQWVCVKANREMNRRIHRLRRLTLDLNLSKSVCDKPDFPPGCRERGRRKMLQEI
ncbi:fimbria/pilus periplasmic chaperone [Salmonella enterica subsp. enterica]|nr:fimbria/pilus periplasmic chaperone [Salmonella enterica subsp. enterica]